ncbi:MAG: enhanced serine sensitivity protein SseB [Lachnospiraceae bacterium]|nr:enhanced serine sensitivity protein SseB [Lachnospiraceae bacterium]
MQDETGIGCRERNHMGIVNNLLGKKEKTEQEGTENKEKADVNKPLENFRLNVLLKEVKENQTETGMNMLFEEIVMNARFLSVVFLSEPPKPNEDGTVTFQKNTTMQMPMLSSTGGKHFYPIFTDHDELARWQKMEKPNTLILRFDDYAAFLEKNEQVEGIVINPFSDNFVLNRKLMAHLKTQKDFRTKGVSQNKISKETKVMVGEPKEYPAELAGALQEHMKGVPAIERAWLRLMIKDNVQSFLAVVDFVGNREEIFGNIAAAVRPYLKNIRLDMIPYQDGFGKKAVENVEPFYQK